MDTHSTSGHLVATADPRLYAHLQRLASVQRLVFFAGLPGTGKSLLSHQLAHLAHAMGRTVHMLQWDVARPVFEASPAGQRYPVVQGVTHGVIRRAAGRRPAAAGGRRAVHLPLRRDGLTCQAYPRCFLPLPLPAGEGTRPLSAPGAFDIPARSMLGCPGATRPVSGQSSMRWCLLRPLYGAIA